MKNHKGFTLIELLGVLFILALLLNLRIPMVNKTIYNASESICRNNRETILRAYERYSYFHNDLNLAEIINDNNWPSEFEMDKDHKYCPLGGEYFVDSNGEILCSIHDSGVYPEETTFYEFITEEDVFLYSSTISILNGNITGDSATILLTSNGMLSSFPSYGQASVSNVYLNGDLKLDGGSFGLGSQTNPGEFIINGDLYLGNGVRSILADKIYVSENLFLKDASVDATIYVAGNVELSTVPTLENDTRIYYGGSITHPSSYSQSILDKVIHVDDTTKFDSIPTREIPLFTMPATKDDFWYVDNGYVSSGNFESAIRLYTDEYIIESSHSTIDGPIDDVVVIAKNGNIEISNQGYKAVRGFLFAPKGKIILSEISSFEGIVIARDGFEVVGYPPISFITVEEIFSSEQDIPFE